MPDPAAAAAERRVVAAALEQDFVITRCEVRELGVPDARVRSLLRRRVWPAGPPQRSRRSTSPTPVTGRTYRVDLLWRERRPVLEADGRGK